MTRALIDGDIFVYRMAIAHQHAIPWDDDTWSVWADLDAARTSIDAAIASIEEWTEADSSRVYLSDTKANWRKEIYPPYKSDRAGWHIVEKDGLLPVPRPQRPMLFTALREHLLNEHEGQLLPTLEADDLLGLAGTKDGGVIVSIDKDLLTVPGRHFNPDHPVEGIVEVSPEEAHRHFMRQALMGDAVDGYPGCPGVGPKTADKILDAVADPDDLWPTIVAQYEKKKLTAEDALTQARCARLLRQGEYNVATGKVTLWTPDINWR